MSGCWRALIVVIILPQLIICFLSSSTSSITSLLVVNAAATTTSALIMSSSSSSSSSSRRKQHPPQPLRVVVVGGTHGNEYTGVWCVKALEATKEQVRARFPSLQVSTLLGNPKAVSANRRFLESDLNREFTQAKLNGCNSNSSSSGSGSGSSTPTATTTTTLEARRAREINALLGPKQSHDDEDDDDHTDTFTTDVVIDLHTTTSNMGICLIVREGDPLMAQAAAYVMQQCNDSGSDSACRIVVHSYTRQNQPSLSSVGRHSFTIEVGPVPQGVLRHDGVEHTQRALTSLLDFLERRQQSGGGEETTVLSTTTVVPCYRSAPAKKEGEISGKISWPCDDTHVNFPAFMIHRSVQDRDFGTLRVGDPLFVKLDGSVVPYDGSHGDEVLLMFVNEGGYYYRSSGTGIAVAVEGNLHLETGTLVNELSR